MDDWLDRVPDTLGEYERRMYAEHRCVMCGTKVRGKIVRVSREGISKKAWPSLCSECAETTQRSCDDSVHDFEVSRCLKNQKTSGRRKRKGTGKV